MTELLKLAAPAMSRCKGFHGDNAPQVPVNEGKQLSARKLLAEYDRPAVARFVKMEDALARSIPSTRITSAHSDAVGKGDP